MSNDMHTHGPYDDDWCEEMHRESTFRFRDLLRDVVLFFFGSCAFVGVLWWATH